MSQEFRRTSSQEKQLSAEISHVFLGRPRVALLGPTSRRQNGPTRRPTWRKDATVRAVFRQSPSVGKGGVDDR